MGRGRSGFIDQSMRKPKVSKDKQKGRPNFEILHSPYKQEIYSLLAIDHIVAEMKKMSPQDVINLLLPSN